MHDDKFYEYSYKKALWHVGKITSRNMPSTGFSQPNSE